MKKCQSCQYENQEDALFCENCGNKFVQTDKPSNESSQKHSCTCGQALKATDKFCPACGKTTASEPALPSQKTTNLQETPVKSPMSKQRKILLGIVITLSSIIIGSFLTAKNYYSLENQQKRLVEIVKNKDINQMKKNTISADPNYTITKEELKKYFDYYNQTEHKEAFSLLLLELASGNGNSDDLVLVKNGKKLFLFDEYQWELKPGYITVRTNQKDMKLFLNNQEKAITSDKQEEIVWGPLTPMNYKVTGELASETTETTVDLIRFQHSELAQIGQVTLNFRKISFKLTSNISGADIYIDNEAFGQLVAGESEVKNLVWHQGMTVQLKKTLEDKSVLETKKEILDEDSYEVDGYDPDSYSSTIELDFSGIQDKSDVELFLSRVYSEVTSDTSSYSKFDEEAKQKLATYFTDGKANVEYQDFETFIQSIRDSKAKSSVSGTPTIESIQMTGKNTYNVQYLIKYKTNYTDYKQDSVSQIFRYKKATMVYDEDKETFSIQSLGGKENFEVVDNGGIE